MLKHATVITTTDKGYAVKMDGSYRDRLIVHKRDGEDADWWEWDMSGRVHGVGLRDRAFWGLAMRNDFRSWIIDVLERCGAGIPVITYPSSDNQAKLDAATAAKTMNRRSVFLIPVSSDRTQSGGSVQFLEAPVNGIAIIQQLILWLEQQIEQLFVGQTMSGGVDSSGGALGGSERADFAGDTKKQKIATAADALQETWTGSDREPGIVSILKKWNYPWATSFDVRMVFNLEKQDPQVACANAAALAGMGIPLKVDEVREAGGFSKPTEDDEVIGMMMPAGPSGEVPEELSDEDITGLFQQGGAGQPDDGEGEPKAA